MVIGVVDWRTSDGSTASFSLVYRVATIEPAVGHVSGLQTALSFVETAHAIETVVRVTNSCALKAVVAFGTSVVVVVVVHWSVVSNDGLGFA